MSEEIHDEVWDIKKIFIGIISIVIIGIGLFFSKDILFSKFEQQFKNDNMRKEVAGAITRQDGNIFSIKSSGDFVKQAIEEKISTIMIDASNISLTEIASSSPQVQKILNDLKTIEQVPRNKAKEMCQKMCDSF
ncbi:hypothetical protein LBMAG33_0340 [Candidatus Levyibacteriota bacterium]|nr:hypothetical protein [Candidatus Levybacteria bacterium]MSU25670.1 hypothetical protein [Candidatus Levybacteria bacterium]GDX61724.1 hypothetical protein LBMAG33_0340 [Candidatus Levybacteria bacterium]